MVGKRTVPAHLPFIPCSDGKNEAEKIQLRFKWAKLFKNLILKNLSPF
jgi:hypothetical protein